MHRSFSTPSRFLLWFCRGIKAAVNVMGVFLLVSYATQVVSASSSDNGINISSSSSQNTVFDYRLASSMPVINTNVTAAVMDDRQDMSGIRCSMLCSTNVGCIAFYYSQSLKRCRLLRDVILPETEDDSLYIIISGGTNPINIALYKPSTSSSILLGYPPYRVVDGNVNTAMITNCTDPYPWLMVDLQYVYSVTEVTVYTSCTCCAYRMHDIDVRVGNTSAPVADFFNGTLCYHRTGSFTTCLNGETYTCATGVLGRYLTIQVVVSSGDYFTPAEVMVKGELAAG